MTNREKLMSEITFEDLHLAFCRRNHDPYLGCLNCPIFIPDRPCVKIGTDNGTFAEWLDKEAKEVSK